jgi:hypothetical protein
LNRTLLSFRDRHMIVMLLYWENIMIFLAADVTVGNTGVLGEYWKPCQWVGANFKQ